MIKSNCCNANVGEGGGLSIATKYHYCKECGKPCTVREEKTHLDKYFDDLDRISEDVFPSGMPKAEISYSDDDDPYASEDRGPFYDFHKG